MGPHDEQNHTVFVVDEFTGDTIQIAELKTVDNLPVPELSADGLFDQHTVTISGCFRLKKMSRKRFVKLLMGKGMSRNDAQGEALICNLTKTPYSVGWFDYVVCGGKCYTARWLERLFSTKHQTSE